MRMQWIGILAGFLLLAVPVTAQVYDKKHDALVAPMDEAAVRARAQQAELRTVGDKEDAMTQDDRYEMMTNVVNEANEKHFQPFENVQK